METSKFGAPSLSSPSVPAAPSSPPGPATHGGGMTRRRWLVCGAEGVAGLYALGAGRGLLHAADSTVPAHVPNRALGAPIEPTVTGVFMQDYVMGGPVTDSQRREVLYVAEDGTSNIYSPVFFRQLEGLQPPTLDRIYPSSTSQTGWARDRIVLPPEPPSGQAVLMPTAVIAPGRDGMDRLMLFRHFCIQFLTLRSDGSIDPFIATMAKLPSIPMTSGLQPTGATYIPELLVNLVPERPANLGGAVHQVVLRDTTSLLTYPVDWTFMTTNMGLGFGERPQIFPLKQQLPNGFAFVAVEVTGEVVYVRLHMAPGDNRFTVQTHLKLGRSQSSCVHVREDVPGALEILLLDPPSVTSITGTYSASSDLQVRSPSSPPQSISEFPPAPVGSQSSMTGVTNAITGSTELYIQVIKPGLDVTSEDLWVTVRRMAGSQAGRWEPPVLLDRGSRFIPFTPADSGTFATFTASAGLDLWRRTEAGTFEQERVFIETDGPIADTQVYRVGVELGASAAPLTGAAMTITASETCVAIVNGKHQVLGPKRPTKALSNQQGAAWITIQVEDGLYIPDILISSPVLAHDLLLKPNDKVEAFLAGVQSDALKVAKDPRTGQPVLPNPANADSVCAAIRQLVALAPKESPRPIAGAPRMAANLAASWVERGSVSGPGRLAALRTEAAAFRLNKVQGVVSFETLNKAQVAQHLSAMAALPIAPMGIFDIFEDVFNWVKDKVEDIVSIVVDGAKVALQVVIDGVSYAYNFAMDTVGAVFDVINMVLDQAGVLLGTALGWLLEQLGFLFDWSAIKRRRNELRDVIYRRAKAVPTFISDPKEALTAFTGRLEAARGTLADTLKKFESNKAASSSFGSFLSETPVLGALLAPGFNLGGGSALPQVMWLVDKAMAVFPGLNFNPGLPGIPNLDSLLGDLAAAVFGMAGKLSGLMQDLARMGFTWITDSRLFSSSTFDPIVEVLIKRLIEILDSLKGIVDAMAAILSALWSKMDKVIDWFDQPLPKSFFGGFYRGLTGNSLSAFDIACLIAAIPGNLNVTNSRHPAMSAAAVDPQADLKEKAKSIMIGHCVTSALNAMYTAAIPKEGDRIQTWVGYAVTAVDEVYSQASSLLMSSAKGNDARFWITTAGTIVSTLVAGAAAGAIKYRRGVLGPSGGQYSDVITAYKMMTVVVHTLNAVVDGVKGATNQLTSDCVAIVQGVLAVAVRMSRPLKPAGLIPLYGGVQGGLTGFRTWIEANEPL